MSGETVAGAWYNKLQTHRQLICSKQTAAKNALRRKKNHEKNLEQTTAQIVQLEQQIYSIEAANINQETLNAMKAAGAAMTQIHGSMTIDKVDETMYVYTYVHHGWKWRRSRGLTSGHLKQGQTPRTAPTQRGDRPGHHKQLHHRTTGRGRSGG